MKYLVLALMLSTPVAHASDLSCDLMSELGADFVRDHFKSSSICAIVKDCLREAQEDLNSIKNNGNDRDDQLKVDAAYIKKNRAGMLKIEVLQRSLNARSQELINYHRCD